MRKFLLGLTVLAGAVVAAKGAYAAPRFDAPIPMVSSAPMAQPVQYYEDWRYGEWRRREAHERFHRHQDWRRERHFAREHDRRGYDRGGYDRGRW